VTVQMLAGGGSCLKRFIIERKCWSLNSVPQSEKKKAFISEF